MDRVELKSVVMECLREYFNTELKEGIGDFMRREMDRELSESEQKDILKDAADKGGMNREQRRMAERLLKKRGKGA